MHRRTSDEATHARRSFLKGCASVTAVAAVGCTRSHPSDEEAVITPGEDLMREHGVLERVLVVWAEVDAPLRQGADVDLVALRSSIDLVRRFGEAYHERLEEDFVFPKLEEAGRERELVRVLRAQHDVGRKITEELAPMLGGNLDAAARIYVADRLAEHSRMYLAHVSRENTIVFPAFREIVGSGYAELGEQFERREHELVGEGAFDHAVEEVALIERSFGLEELAHFTPV